MKRWILLAFALITLLTACTAPKTVIVTEEVVREVEVTRIVIQEQTNETETHGKSLRNEHKIEMSRLPQVGDVRRAWQRRGLRKGSSQQRSTGVASLPTWSASIATRMWITRRPGT